MQATTTEDNVISWDTKNNREEESWMSTNVEIDLLRI